MFRSSHLQRQAIALGVGALLCLSAQAQSSYTFLELKNADSSADYSSLTALAINNGGVVVGRNKIYWKTTWMRDGHALLGYSSQRQVKLIGATWSRTGKVSLLDSVNSVVITPEIAVAINASGAVAGMDSSRQPVLIAAGKKTVLEKTQAEVYGMNDQGAVVGFGGGHARLWANGKAQDLSPDDRPDLDFSIATGINNLGQITLTQRTYEPRFGNFMPSRCVVLTGSTRQTLGQDNKALCSVLRINDNGVAIGQIGDLRSTMFGPDRMTGVTWQGNGSPQALPLPTAGVPAGATVWLEPTAINKSGVIVGKVQTNTPYTVPATGAQVDRVTQSAFVSRNGQTLDLNTLTTGLPSSFAISEAPAINDEGRILVRLIAKGSPLIPFDRVGVLIPKP
jgi:uncharacterized membrane protein